MRKSFLFIILMMTVALFQSCEKESINDNPENLVAPTPPPTEYYNIPTASLRDDDAENNSNNPPSGATYHHWVHAGVNLLVWNTVVVVRMAVPVAAFAEAFNHQAEYIGNATFEWDYSHTSQLEKTFNIILTGQYINNTEEVAWTMTASKDGGFQDFVWYTGVTGANNTYGTFTLNKNPNNPIADLELSYTRNNNNLDGTTRLTNVNPNSNGNGQYIEYRTESANAFNRSFDLQLEAGNFLEIQWNEPSGEGRVRHEKHFDDTDWHCWDVDKIDVDC